MVREIVLDTETTGLSPNDGHRIIEIGAVELWNHIPTGETFHVYINPERDVPAEAVAVHGLDETFLKDKPLFSQVVDDMLNFLQDSDLIIHNAEFDLRFLNHELAKLGFQALTNKAVDTVQVARKKFPGARASLDALCDRFGIDRSNRTLHGALLDSEILADVYLELLGGRQTRLGLKTGARGGVQKVTTVERTIRTPRDFPASNDEVAAHRDFLKKFSGPLWAEYLEDVS